MKLFIADQTCSQAEAFAEVNPLLYGESEPLSEAAVRPQGAGGGG